MAGPEYNLGGFGDQLSADELQRAMLNVGGGAPAPAPVAPEPAPLPDMSVRAAQGNPRQQLAEYVQGDLADQNQKIALAGESGQDMAAVHQARATMRREQAGAQQQRNQVADTRAEAAHARGEKKQQEADHLLDEMRAHMSMPSKSAGEKAWGVLGGLLAMGSGGRAASGVQFISQMTGSDRKERWAAEQQARSGLYQAVTHGIDLDNATEAQQHEVARRMGAADALYWDAALEGVSEEGLSKEAVRVKRETQLDLRQKARGLLRADAEKRQAEAAAAAKAGAAHQKDAREQWFWNRSLEELNQMPNSVLGEVGQEVRAKMAQRDQSSRKNEQDLLKAQQEAGPAVVAGQETPSGRIVENPAVYAQVSPVQRAKLADADQAANDLNSAIDELLKLRREHPFAVGVGIGGVGTAAYDRAPVINQRIQLALKKADTLGTLDKGSVDFLNQMTGDPTSWTNAPENKLNEIKLLNTRGAESRAKQAGLSAPALEAKSFAKGVGGGLQNQAGKDVVPTITLIRPDGKTFKVHPTQANALRQQGWQDPEVSGGTLVMRPGDELDGQEFSEL